MKKQKLITIIKRSCLTDQPVWIYQGPTEEAARKAYYRTKRAEKRRVMLLPKFLDLRRRAIERFLNDLLGNLPLIAELTREQRAAVKELKALAQQPPQSDKAFWEHCKEETRRWKKRCKKKT